MITFYIFGYENEFSYIIILRIMGQETSCLTRNHPNAQFNKKQEELQMRRRMNPLHYVKPVDFQFEQPQFTLQPEETYKNNSEEKQNEIPIKEEVEQDKQVEQASEEKEIMFKKVEVKWNKFIKMKRKNFLADYKVISEIGRGGFGCVYKVIMKNGNIYRAAKKINKNHLKAEEHQSLLAQMAIMMHMDHPNITKLYQVYEQQNYYVMILQLCDGGELFEKVVDRTITQRDAKHIINQVLSALHYLHSKGIVHRDIKPQNMLFEQKTKLVKLIDFGISTKIEKHQILSSRVGTPYYIAPEVLAKKYNQKCDIWSLGVVLFMIVYNNPPFKGDNPARVMESIIRDDIHFRNPASFQFSYQSLQFLKKLLTKNPNLRPSAQEALHHTWLQDKSKHKTPVIEQQKDKVLQRITKFHFKNKLEAVVYTYIVSQLLSSEQRVQLLGLFRQLDKNQNGIIEVSELKNALANKSYFEISQEKIQIIRDYLDTNCSGAIDYTEFLVGSIDFSTKIQQRHLEQAFRYFDIDNSGQITFQEVAKFLQNQVATQEEIRQLFKEVDQNGDGVISKSQFVQLLAYKRMQKK